MKKIIISTIFISLLFVSAAFCKVDILYPPNHLLTEESSIMLSGFSTKKISKDLTLSVEGDEEYSGKSRVETFKLDKNNTFSAKIRLYPGINKISLEEEERYVYFDDKTMEVPYAFSKYFEHSSPECENCHETDPVFVKEISGEFNDICNECHDRVDGKENIHPGYEDSSCIDCHEPHFSKFKGHLQKDMKELCAECHDSVTEIKNAPFTIVHPPVDLGHCEKCHDPHASNNDFFLTMPVYELCTACHPEPRDFGHADIYDDCLMCHEHHRSRNFLILKDGYWEHCLDCHDEVADQKFKHLPKGRGCGDCHDPHSDTDIANVKKGCKNCHRNKDKEFNRFHGGLKLPVEKCFKCHKPHDAYNKRLLISKLHFPLTQAGNCITCHTMTTGRRKKTIGWVVEKSEVCFKCHGEKKPLVGYDKSMHPPVFNGDCVQCHSPHLKLEKSQLLIPPEELCYKCHESFTKRAKKVENSSLHLPVEEDDCLVCHNPHKSEHNALLENAPNGLCFDCHYEKNAIIDGKSLIFYHDPPTEDLCTNCHDPHWSEKKALVK